MRLDQTKKSMSTPTSHRCFAGAKISKVRWTNDTTENVDTFLTGTWNTASNSITLWKIRHELGGGEENFLNSPVFTKKSTIQVGGDVNDLSIIPGKKAAAALENGEVILLDLTSKNDLVHLNTYKATEKRHAATTVCIIENHLYVGTEAGAIMRVSTDRFTKPSYFAKELTTVRSMTKCGPMQIVTGHTSSQLHLWDLRTLDPVMTVYPSSTKAASSFSDAITALASNPAEPNLISYGTKSGSVGFFDIRRSETAMPNMLTVANDPITELKFHPVYANNCFSATQNSLVHWDATSIGRSATRVLTNTSMEIPEDETRQTPWLMANVYNSIQLTELLEDDFKFISTFDVAPNAIVVGSDSLTLALIENTKFL